MHLKMNFITCVSLVFLALTILDKIGIFDKIPVEWL